MAKPCRVVVSPQLAEVLNLEPNQDLSYREWVQILHDGGLDKLADRALVALGEVKKGAKEAVELQNELEVREQRSMNEPRDAKDVAIIFRKLFNFSPFEAVAAARIFDAKAARMSKLLGISKEDYYKRYWFTGEQEGGLNQIDNFKIDDISKSEQIPMDDYTAIVEKAINDAGYYTRISRSRTDFGDSNYIYAYLSEEDYMKGGEGIKFRISDHSVTNVNRLFNEVHLPFRIDKKNIESVAKNAVKEIEFKFAREKYFTSQDVFEDEKTTFEVNEKNLQPTDKIISERFKKGTEDKKVFLIERIKKVPYTIWKDKRDGKEFAKFRRSYAEFQLFQTDSKESLSQMTLPDGREVTVKRMSPEVVNGFYSPIEKNLMEYGKDKIKAKDWLNVVGKGDEAVFTGVRAFLEGKDPNAMVSKQEILDYMKDNRISVVEVVKGSYKEGFLNDQWTPGAEENKGTGRIWKNNGWKVVENSKSDYSIFYPDGTQFEGSWSTKEGAFDRVRMEAPSGTTKFSQYQLEGEKENYKEVLVTLPSQQTTEQRQKRIDSIDKRREYLQNQIDTLYKQRKDETKEYKDLVNENEQLLQERQKILYNREDNTFRSTHFDEPNILVHLRMNTRTDADGNKVLFLEEVQSDWGQLGKKEGFEAKKNKIKWREPRNVNGYKVYDSEIGDFTIIDRGGNNISLLNENGEEIFDGRYTTVQEAKDGAENEARQFGKGLTPTAPFVMDTNAWTKLGLKVALKEAVAQGVDKIAWTTGEQQNDRYDLSKQVDEITYSKYSDGTYQFSGSKNDNQIFNYQRIPENKLEDYVGKEIANKIINGEGDVMSYGNKEEGTYGELGKTLSGVDLKVGGKGMKGFYGSMEEGTKGIVGGVAEKVFGQKVGTVEIQSENFDTKKIQYLADKYDVPTFMISKAVREGDLEDQAEIGLTKDEVKVVEMFLRGSTTQPSVDITPELKAQVQEGLPLFQGDRKGAWSKEAAKAKRIISMYQKADSTTQAHEVVGHDFLDEIIQLSSTNEEMAEDLNTIVDEFIKETGSKVSKEKLLKDLKDFDVEKKQNQNGKDIHEWFAESAERYFATERGAREGAGFSKKMVALFEKFRQYMADLYSKMNKELVEPSPAMKQIFRKIFGAENFAEAEEMRKATFDRMNSLQASELEMNYSKSKLKLSDIINKYKPKEGLGQLSDDFVQDMYNAASIIVKDGEATRWNVTNKLQELMPHLKSEIEQLRKVLQEVGTKGNLRGGVENLLANPYITDEVKEKIAKLSEYTPESMAKVGLNAEQILSYYIGEADNNDIVGMQTVAKLLAEGKFDGFTEKVSLRQLLIANYNQLAKITKDENKRIDYVNAAVDQAEAYAIEGTGMGRMINMYKALGSLTADGLIVWAKRQEMKFTKPSFERFKSEIKDLKKRLKKAQEDIDYFFEQVVGREETEAQYKEVIAAYQAEIDALKSRKPKEPKASKSAYRNVKNKAISITDDAYKSAINALKSSKLFQDLSNLTPAQTVAYYLMERKPMNISQFAKEFSKALDKKVDPSELKELYQQTRDMLILKDIGYAEGLSANEELEKDLQDLEDTKRAKIEELERKKAAAEAKLAEKKAKKEGKAQDPADKLSNFVLSDLKRAMSGTLPKQKTYVEELLSALTQKAKEVALKGEKGTQKQAPITPIEAIKKALDAIQNGRPDASIWNDAVEQVKQKIEQDSDLSQQDKEDLNLYLNDYTSFVYDNMLNDSVILKAIKENLIANGYGSGNTVNFKALIVADGQAQMQERQRLIEKLKQDLSQYDPVQVEKVLDAIAERYQRLINEKRKQIADEYINQTFKTKSPSTRRAIRGTIGKLIMENRMGLFDDTNNAILDALAEKKGFTNMTSADWAKIKEYADLVEALPLDSNLQNEALEEMTAFVRTKMPGRWLLIATAVRYGVLLGRITSNIKNAVGGFEQALTLTLARAMRGDTEFGKSALKGFGQGDFKDVLIGGGINQANRISVEADANGMPRFRVLEYLKPKTIGGKVVESVKYSGRMLDAMDSIWQKFFTSGYDIKYMRKLLQLENPNATKQEIDDMVNKIFSNDRIDDYMDQATKEVIASGKKVTEAKVRRRAYEIMRDSLVRPIAKQLADFESTEKTYKTDFLENFGVGTGAGFVALYIANASKSIVEPLVERIVKMKTKGVSDEYAKEQAKIYSSIIPNFILPFSKGLSGFIEKGLERELIYGLTKSIAVSIAAKSKTPTTIEEKMAQYRAIEKAKDIATSAVVTNLILYGIGGALYAMSKQWEDDEEKEGRYHPKTGVYGKAKPMTIKGVTVKEKAEPENVIVLFGEEIPLSYVGGLGVTAMVDANLYKAFTEETDERKKTKAMEVASNFGTATLYTMDSFLSQAWLMQASDNKSITEMIQEGNTERALNLIQNTMINYMGSYIPWSGFINQSLQGARELSGGETYQEAKTISEKIQKQFGLAGITYTNTKKNYLGEDIKYSDVNKEGIIGLVNMFKTKSISAEDNWLRNIGFKEKASGQYAKGLKDLDGYSPSIEEYDRYDDRTKSMFGIIAKEAYNQKANIVPLPNEINRVTKKPYTVDEFQSKVMRSALSAVSKYNIVRLKKERGDYNSDKDAYEQDMENAFYNLDEVADIIYYKKGDEYKNRKRKKDALIDKVTEIK